MRLRFLIEKEFKQFRRNVFLPQMLIMYPLMIMLVFPWAANLEIKNMNLSVVDHSKGQQASRLIRKATASGYFKLTHVTDSYLQALSNLEYDRSDVILEIPADFETTLQRENKSRVLIIANAVNGTKGALATSYLSSIIADFNRELDPHPDAVSVLPKIRVEIKNRFNPNLDYKRFMIPAFMVVILTLICGFLPALNIVSEKESGTIEQMNVTPVPKYLFILSKLIPYWLLGILLLTFCMLLVKFVYGLFPAGSLWAMYGYTLLFIVLISGFGLIISNKSQTLQQAMFIMFFFLIVFILMSGLFTPIASMPVWARALTYLNPLRYFVDIMRCIYLRGTTFMGLLSNGLILLIFAVVFNVWAVLSYRKNH